MIVQSDMHLSVVRLDFRTRLLGKVLDLCSFTAAATGPVKLSSLVWTTCRNLPLNARQAAA